jgi:hypothetical protein
MATAEEIVSLRRMVNEPTNTAPWTDDTLGLIIDAAIDLDAAAASVWRSKAASVAHLVDISEGGSSRKMSEMHKNFLSIAEGYEQTSAANPALPRAPRTREIVR